MIAESGSFYPFASSGTVVTSTSAANSTFTPYVIRDCNFTLYLPCIERRDPKRRIPFYRALFDQDFPNPVIPCFREVDRRNSWRPLMGNFEARPVSRFGRRGE